MTVAVTELSRTAPYKSAMNIPRTIPLVLLTATLGLAGAGCGSNSPRSGGGSSAQGAASGPYAYAACIRSHGVGSFPDPQVTTRAGSVSARQMIPSAVASSPAFKKAQRACARLQPGPNGPTSEHHGPSKTILLAFARCLRAHGITRFPDPTASGGLSLSTISADGVNVHTHAFFAAARGCLGVTHGQITAAQVAALVNGAH